MNVNVGYNITKWTLELSIHTSHNIQEPIEKRHLKQNGEF